MFEDVPASLALALAIAFVPAALHWWRGRALVRLADDPALPERLLANRRRAGAVLGVTILMLLVGWPDTAVWTIPLTIGARAAAAYPLRKALYGETWSLAQYLWFWTRLIVSVYGFWIALLLLPVLAGYSRSFDWLMAAALAAPLVWLSTRHGRSIRYALGARPLPDAALLARFAPMVEACKVGPVAFEYVDLRGGAISNALALPSATDPAVLFTSTLLAQLDEDEITAICAHELAHLEHFNPHRLRVLNTVTYGLIAIAAIAAPLARLAGVTWSILPFLTVAAAIVSVLAWRARDRQRNETASDLRAVELTGHPEALVTALTKGYTFARIPRRLDAQVERHATHPSLARRIRAIRDAGGTAPAALGSTPTFAAARGLAAVTFHDACLQWAEGDAAVHTLNYAYLSEMRLDARTSGAPTLVVVERTGRRWELPLAASDVARAQSVLDVVDGRLAEPAAAPRVWPRAVRALAAFAALTGGMGGQVALALVALIAMAQPASPLLAAAGVAALTTAAIVVRDFSDGTFLGVAGLVALFGVLLLVTAWTSRRDEMPKQTPAAIAVLGICAALAMSVVIFSGLDPVRLYQSSRSFPGAAVLVLGVAGALALWSVPVARPAAALLAAAGIAVASAGSTLFLNLFGSDPFLVRSEAMIVKTVDAAPSAEFTVPFPVSDIRLSPAGGHVAAVSFQDADAEDDEFMPAAFRIGPARGPLTRLRADDVAFVDEDHLLAFVKPEPGEAEVRLLELNAQPTIVWQQHVRDLQSAHLTFKPATRTWRLMGWDRARNLVRLEGVVGQAGSEETRWPAQDVRGGWAESMTSSGGNALLVRSEFDIGMLGRGGLLRWGWLFRPQAETHIVSMRAAAPANVTVSRLGAQCAAVALEDERLVCTSYDGTLTRVASLDPAGRVTPIGSLAGRFVGYERTGAGWLTGWAEASPIAVRIATREALRIKGPAAARVSRIAAVDHLLATVSFTHASSTIRLYPLPN
ncbi:MAG: hypothetical protein DMF85_19255 [Acidobacteria bacterium]|nr:MAG: hypothetical protein DMF85_19255 [Acidobacteriota bacterium]